MFSSIVWTLAACSGLGPSTTLPVTTDVSSTGDTGVEALAEPAFAGGIKIDKVTFNQSVEITLVEDGVAPAKQEAPVIADRAGLLRVFLNPKPAWEPRRVNAILTVNNGGEKVVLEEKLKIEQESIDDDLDSTINFELDRELVGPDVKFTVEIREVDTEAPGGGSVEDNKWKSDQTGGFDVDVSDEITVVIIPVAYHGDGSGRLPDTSQNQINMIQDLLMGIYPATDVTVRVDPPIDWYQDVNPLSSWQWSALLDEISTMRDQANEDPNTYYYGMFNGDTSLNAYCSFGCILGLSNLGYSPNIEYLRASIGLGFTGIYTAETLVHEVGHAHGREHAPCGIYDAGDRGYPYTNASIGVWGYDILSGATYDPGRVKDMMSYCSPIWLSDYTYDALASRIAVLGAQARGGVRSPRTVLTVDADGAVLRTRTLKVGASEGGVALEVDLVDAAGLPAGTAMGQFFPFSHFGGGSVALDRELPPGVTAVVPPLP